MTIASGAAVAVNVISSVLSPLQFDVGRFPLPLFLCSGSASFLPPACLAYSGVKEIDALAPFALR